MHKDVILIDKDKANKPCGQVHVVYFSSLSENTHKFMNKLNVNNSRIPYDIEDQILLDKDFVLITPTYAGGGNLTKGAVPKQVIKFLNDESNRKHCKGVIATGNTNFGDTYALAGPIISKKLNIPMLYQFEMIGTADDVKNVRDILNRFWGEKNEE